MAKTKEIRRRIQGMQNTRKITHAMELVAATKMRRAIAAVLATRRYAQLAWGLLAEVRRRSDVAHHPLLEGRAPVRRSLLLVVAGNRGLVGAFNQKLVALALATARAEGVPVRMMTAGRVAARLLRRAGAEVVADFPKKDIVAEPRDASPIARELLRAFVSGDADRVRMVYADFHSPVRQEPRVRTLFPVGEPDPALGLLEGEPTDRAALPEPQGEFLYEPSPPDVLGSVVPNLLSIQVYQALLETTAAEHAARMVAMKNATDNAEEFAEELALILNQARQQQITRELQEIVAGTLV